MQEFSSGSELIQALQEDDYARQLVAPAGGIKQQIDNKKDKTICFSWVTDLENTQDNVYDLMRTGRARWRIENETFNTLKNQGINLEHNYGLGKKNLSCIFTIMMMAFLIDQIQQMNCWLFKEAKVKAGSKRYLRECIRSYFRIYQVDSVETIYRAIPRT
jgi:hypothetical protein